MTIIFLQEIIQSHMTDLVLILLLGAHLHNQSLDLMYQPIFEINISLLPVPAPNIAPEVFTPPNNSPVGDTTQK